jgi:hypothetical protein
MQKERGGKRVDKGGALFILAGSRPSPGNYTRKDDLVQDEKEDKLDDELSDSDWRTRRRGGGR